MNFLIFPLHYYQKINSQVCSAKFIGIVLLENRANFEQNIGDQYCAQENVTMTVTMATAAQGRL